MKLLLLSLFITFLIMVKTASPTIDHITKVSSNKTLENVEDIIIDNIFFEKSNTIIKQKTPSYTVSFKENPKLKGHSLNQLIKNTKCIEKTGFLYILDSFPSPGKTNLATKKVFISLTPDLISIFTSTKKEDLKDTIKTKKILRITQMYKGTLCIDIHQQIGTESLPIKVVTFCMKSKNSLNEWITAFVEFKKCEIVESEDLNINKSSTSISNIHELARSRLEKISYSSIGSSRGSIRINKRSLAKSSAIKKSLKGLLSTYKKGKLAGVRIRRQYRGRLSNQIQSNIQEEQQEYSIKKLMETREAKERQNQMKLIKLEHKNKELSLINEAQKKIKELKVKN